MDYKKIQASITQEIEQNPLKTFRDGVRLSYDAKKLLIIQELRMIDYKMQINNYNERNSKK